MKRANRPEAPKKGETRPTWNTTRIPNRASALRAADRTVPDGCERRKQLLRRRSVFMLWMVCVLWLGVLIWLSSEDGAATAQTSGRLTAFVVALFRLPAQNFEKVDHALRTLAHGVGFLILGWLA